MFNNPGRLRRTFDAALEFGAAQTFATAATHVLQNGGADGIVEVGTGRVHADAIFDVTAAAIDGNDEIYYLQVLGSLEEDASADIVVLGAMPIGAKEVIPGDTDLADGRYQIAITNVVGEVVYPYLFAQVVAAGATVSITVAAFLAKQHGY